MEVGNKVKGVNAIMVKKSMFWEPFCRVKKAFSFVVIIIIIFLSLFIFYYCCFARIKIHTYIFIIHTIYASAASSSFFSLYLYFFVHSYTQMSFCHIPYFIPHHYAWNYVATVNKKKKKVKKKTK